MTEPEPQPDAPSAVSPPEPAITLTSRLKQDASENIDLNMATVYAHCTIITMNKNRDIILDGAIVVFKDRITCVVKWEVVRSVIVKDTVPDGYTLVDCTGRILMPGLINTHAHLAQSLLRGLAEGMSLRNWLCDAIWPLEAQYGGDDGYVAARLTIAEMLKSGTTCFLESMLTHHSGFDNVARAVEESGIRACLAKLVKIPETDPKAGMVDPRDAEKDKMTIGCMIKAHDKYHHSCGGRLHVWASASTNRGSGLQGHLAIGEACKEAKIGITMHCAESPSDLEAFRSAYDMTPGQFCIATKLAGPKTVLAHMVNIDKLELDLPILQSYEVSVAHCPNSNLKLASGIASIPEMLNAGVNVTLGTDGAPCGNTYDMFREMHLAGILHKGNKKDASIVGAEDVLEMATINGAKALNIDREVGSIENGKKADFILINPHGLQCAPFDEDQILDGGLDPVTTVVYSCTGRDVETVVVNGEVLVSHGELVKQDEREIIDAAKLSIKGIRERAAITIENGGTWSIL